MIGENMKWRNSFILLTIILATALYGSGCDTGGVVNSGEKKSPEVGKNLYYDLYTEIFPSYEEMMDGAEDAVLDNVPTCTRMGVTYAETPSGNFEVISATCLEQDPTGGGDSGGSECNSGFGGDPTCTLTPDPIDREVTQVNRTDVCPSDPLADMEIRGTCDGIEGGRFGGRGGAHEGMDLLADVGTDVHSISGGTVVNTGNDSDGWGNWIIVESSSGEFFLYAHLSSFSVMPGQSVSQGDGLGDSGISGNACANSCSCGPAHVHVEVRTGGDSWETSNNVDPEDYIGTDFDEDGVTVSDTC
jgi:hypothetical protein